MAENNYDDALFTDGRNLVTAAEAGLLAPVYFRDDEVRAVLDDLDGGHSVLLVGPAGVGKTSLVHAVARAMAARGVGCLVELSTTSLMAGTRYLGEWQTKVTAVARAAIDQQVVLYIPDVRSLNQVGRTAQSDSNLLEALRPHMRNGLRILGEVTPEVLRAMGRVDGFASLFRKVNLRPLTDAQVDGCLARASAFSDLSLDQAARQALVAVTSRFLPAMPQPGPALELLRRVRDYVHEKRGAGEDPDINVPFIERVFSIYSGLPLFVISRSETRSVQQIRQWFQEHIVGQQEAIEAVIESIALFKAGLHDPNRPIGTFFFVGPTGVGKTELARTLAHFLFGSPARLLRFDLSEFKDYHSFEMLVGSAREPERPAALIDPVRQQPFQVVLFDELEKAHTNVWDLLLQFLDEGRLTPPGGAAVDFRNTIFIATSNAGAQESERSLGFANPKTQNERRQSTLRALEANFRPELLNRFQHIVVFHPLSRDQVRTVARHELKRILGREGITARNLVVEVEDAALDLVIDRGFDPRYGARALKREIQRQLVLPLATTLMEKPVEAGQILKVVAQGDQVRVRALDTPESRELRRENAPVKVEGRALTRKEIHAELRNMRGRVEALAVALREPFLQQGRERLNQMRRDPGFWQDPEAAARALRDLDRVTAALDRLDNLRNWGEELEAEMVNHPTRDKLEQVAQRLTRYDGSILRARRELLLLGWEGAWDALVEISPLAPGGRLARDMLVEIYQRWVGARTHSLDWLRDPAGPDEPTMFAIKGPYAYGLLRLESGLHRVRGEDGLSVARVRVGPWTDERGPTRFTEHQALKAEGSFGERVRSRLACEGGLVLRNHRTLAENRELAAEVAPCWAKAPPPSDDIVRRYDLEPPLVRDALTGWTSGKPDALDARGFVELLYRRAEEAAAGARNEAGGEG